MLGLWHDAKVLQHALGVHLEPRLDKFAAVDAVDGNAGDRDLPPGGRDAHEGAALCAAERPPGHYFVGFRDLVIDNASDEGGKVVLKDINTPKTYADSLLKQMRRLEK